MLSHVTDQPVIKLNFGLFGFNTTVSRFAVHHKIPALWSDIFFILLFFFPVIRTVMMFMLTRSS